MCLCFVLAAGAQRGAADDLGDILGRSNVEASDALSIRALFEQADRRGVPARMLLPRLEEGLSKRVPAAGLLGALERELRFLEEARSILEAEAGNLLRDDASWARTANLLLGGLPVEEVRALLRVASGRPGDYRPASYLYVSLAEWGLPREQARLLLESLLASAISGGEFEGVVGLLAEGRRLRIRPEQLVERIQETAPQARSLEELRTLVLR